MAATKKEVPKRLVKSATRWPDDHVAAFDEQGKEISELTGKYEVMREAIFARSTQKTVFRRVIVSTKLVDTGRESW